LPYRHRFAGLSHSDTIPHFTETGFELVDSNPDTNIWNSVVNVGEVPESSW
jgi:hypothetical protein